MKQLILNLSDSEMEVLERMAKSQDVAVEHFVQQWIKYSVIEDDFPFDDHDENEIPTRPLQEDIVNNTFASNPGHVQLQWFRFWRAYPTTPICFGVAFTLIVWLVINKSVWWAFPLLVLVPLLLLIMQRIKTQFQSGDTNPGVIVSHNPPLVAVRTDLTTGFGEYPVIKILKQPLAACRLNNVPIGTRVATCSLYSPSTTDKSHWFDFDPVIVQAATNKPEVHQAKLESISPEEWVQLEQSLTQLPIKTPNLYPIGWEPLKGALYQEPSTEKHS